MKLQDKVVVVTGAASGIGRALAERFAAEGARCVVAADIDAEGARRVAEGFGGVGIGCDVREEAQLAAAIDAAEQHGPVDLFCSNAGILEMDTVWDNAASAADSQWQRSWDINVMAHVKAARLLLPKYIARGGGYFLNTASAAGLLSQIGGAPYSVTKHAAVGFAESLAITHKDHGVKVSILCPQGVRTNMLRVEDDATPAAGDGVLTAEAVAQCVVEGLERERFLILPHPQVSDYMSHKAADYDRWLGGMSKLRRSYGPGQVG
jgi:NAD(P)-dependent dehydrogenase (short-subunit alcohol dehydrogenase family)